MPPQTRKAVLVLAWDQYEDTYGEDFSGVLQQVEPAVKEVAGVIGNPHVTAAVGPTAEAVLAAFTGAGQQPVQSSPEGEGNDDESTTDSGTVTP